MVDVFVCGVGVTKFRAPGTSSLDYPDYAQDAIRRSLTDAGVDYNDVTAVVVSYCYGEPTAGQRAVYGAGMTGVPIFNTNNNCSSASSAVMLARALVMSGEFECVLAVGMEKMSAGLSAVYTDRVSPVDRHFQRLAQIATDGRQTALTPLPGMNVMTSEVVRMFALAAREYISRTPSCTAADLAAVAVKNRRHGASNENASQFGRRMPSAHSSETERMLCAPITVHQAAMTACGAAAAVLCSPTFADRRLSLSKRGRCVRIAAQSMCTDMDDSLAGADGDKWASLSSLIGYRMAEKAANRVYRTSGYGPSDVDVCEVHDCFSVNELFMYEALHFTPPSTAAPFFRSGRWVANASGGQVYRCNRVVVNPSGGLESKGHPIGATGLAQCAELVNQLRGECEERQVPNARVALQHNFGIGGAAVVTIYDRQIKSHTAAKL